MLKQARSVARWAADELSAQRGPWGLIAARLQSLPPSVVSPQSCFSISVQAALKMQQKKSLSPSGASLPSSPMTATDFAAIASVQPSDRTLRFLGSGTPLNTHPRRLGGTHSVSLWKGIIHFSLVTRQLQWALIIPPGHPAV